MDLGHDTHITFIGHATTLVEMAGVNILTDPVLRSSFRFLKRSQGMLSGCLEVDRIDAVVLSHMHFDHMDYPSLRMISDKVPIVAPEGAGRYLRRNVPHEIVEMKLGESIRLGAVEIHATPSLHESGFYWPMWFPKNVFSYMFVGPQTVHFIGDTALFDGMRELREEFDIDVAMVPVWGCGPYLRGDHMTPAQAADALEMLKPRVAVPIHWGTLHPMGSWWKKMSFLQYPPHAFALEATRRAPETDVRVLMPGERTVVGRDPFYVEEFGDIGLPVAALEPALV
jgi:L-ascorbate metabolism protein UlaG (beta-lactamase superfamily)